MSIGTRRFSKSAAIRFLIWDWGFNWQLGGREFDRDQINIFRLEFYLGDLDARFGWRLAIPHNGGLLYYRCKAGRWEGWQLRGPWQKVLG